MNHQFDELAKGLAQSVTRRGALKKFGVGLVGVALVSLGMVNRAAAGGGRKRPPKGCGNCNHCVYPYGPGDCYYTCYGYCNGPGGF